MNTKLSIQCNYHHYPHLVQSTLVDADFTAISHNLNYIGSLWL